MHEKTYYKTLVDRYTSRKASDDELLVFFDLVKQGKLDELLSDSFLNPVGINNVMAEAEDTTAIEPPKHKTGRVLKIWIRVAAAAVFIGIVSTVAILYFNKTSEPQKNITHATKLPVQSPDLPPGGSRATLTLADGSSILLDSAANGQLAQQGNLKIIKLADRLVYQANPAGSAAGVVSYNTISTPRGGQYQVTLPDGTMVWLNAESSLHYPTVFNNKERLVELEGECYFEVAHNPSVPFRIKMNKGVSIKVLGTHFNVHSYNDEPTKATLLEGSIKIQSENAAAVLKPGQAATIKKSGELNIVNNADLDQAIAWKNGLFQFDRADINTVMRQIERWYDVQVVYEGKIPDKEFVGKVSRNSKLSEVLQILELSKIHFKTEGRKIIVMP